MLICLFVKEVQEKLACITRALSVLKVGEIFCQGLVWEFRFEFVDTIQYKQDGLLSHPVALLRHIHNGTKIPQGLLERVESSRFSGISAAIVHRYRSHEGNCIDIVRVRKPLLPVRDVAAYFKETNCPLRGPQLGFFDSVRRTVESDDIFRARNVFDRANPLQVVEIAVVYL